MGCFLHMILPFHIFLYVHSGDSLTVTVLDILAGSQFPIPRPSAAYWAGFHGSLDRGQIDSRADIVSSVVKLFGCKHFGCFIKLDLFIIVGSMFGVVHIGVSIRITACFVLASSIVCMIIGACE